MIESEIKRCTYVQLIFTKYYRDVRIVAKIFYSKKLLRFLLERHASTCTKVGSKQDDDPIPCILFFSWGTRKFGGDLGERIYYQYVLSWSLITSSQLFSLLPSIVLREISAKLLVNGFDVIPYYCTSLVCKSRRYLSRS